MTLNTFSTICGAQAHRGFVEQQQARTRQQGTPDGQHLLLAARERAGDLMQAFANGRQQRMHALHADKLRAYRAIEARDFAPEAEPTRRRRIHHLILKAGIQYEQGWIAWYDEAVSTLAHG